jgi:hypothetical protein
VRTWQTFFRTAQDDPSLVFVTSINSYIKELPFVLSFKLQNGKLVPSPSKFAAELIDTTNVWLVHQFEVIGDKVLYARC